MCPLNWPRISSPERRPKREGRRRRWFSKRLELVLEIRCSWWPMERIPKVHCSKLSRAGWDISWWSIINQLGWLILLKDWELGPEFLVWSRWWFTHMRPSFWWKVERGDYLSQQGNATRNTTTLINDLVNMAWCYRNQYLSKLSGSWLLEHTRANLVGSTETSVRSAPMMSFLCPLYKLCELSHSTNFHRNCIVLIQCNSYNIQKIYVYLYVYMDRYTHLINYTHTQNISQCTHVMCSPLSR